MHGNIHVIQQAFVDNPTISSLLSVHERKNGKYFKIKIMRIIIPIIINVIISSSAAQGLQNLNFFSSITKLYHIQRGSKQSLLYCVPFFNETGSDRPNMAVDEQEPIAIATKADRTAYDVRCSCRTEKPT